MKVTQLGRDRARIPTQKSGLEDLNPANNPQMSLEANLSVEPADETTALINTLTVVLQDLELEAPS